ncbi:unnamed protein product [Musa hybrid cultivar]
MLMAMVGSTLRGQTLISALAYAGFSDGSTGDAVREAAAVGEADGVSTGEGDHVSRGEVVLAEHGGEEVDAEFGAREVAGYSISSRRDPVAPTQLHGEGRTAGLVHKVPSELIHVKIGAKI